MTTKTKAIESQIAALQMRLRNEKKREKESARKERIATLVRAAERSGLLQMHPTEIEDAVSRLRPGTSPHE